MVNSANKKLKLEIFEITTGLLLGDGNLQKPFNFVRMNIR